MQAASLPANEPDRLQALHSFGILDTPPDPAFDRITALAARMFSAPIAMVSLVDEERQWFKSRVGITLTQTDRKFAFCAYVVALGELLSVEDAHQDPRFCDNPLVIEEPKIRFYVGAPLQSEEGYILGTLCLMDRSPRQFSEDQQRNLVDLAQTVIALLERQRTKLQLSQSEVLLKAETVEAQRLNDEILLREAQHQQTQKALRASEMRYHRMLATLNGMVFQLVLLPDGSYQFPWVSEGCREIYGLDPQQLQAKPHLAIEAMHPHDRAIFAASIAHSAKFLAPWKWEGRIYLRSGEPRWVQGTGHPEQLSNGNHLWNMLLIDITERITAQQKLLAAQTELEELVQERTNDLLHTNSLLRQEEASLVRAIIEQQAIFNATPDCIVVINLDGCILRCNNRFMTVTGLATEAIEGRTMLSFIPEAEHELLSCAIKNTYTRGEDEVKVHVIAKEGVLLLYHWKAVAIYEESGEMSSFMAVGRNITEQLQVERELIAASETALEASRLKTEFLANMSHEIRTPMNGVIGMTSLLLDTELTEEQSDYVETVRSSGEALLTIINDILDFSKVEAGKLDLEVTDFELRRVVEEVCELLFESAQQKKLELICFVEYDIPEFLQGDSGRLRQVLVNLVSNAIKFTTQGEVLIHVRLVQPTNNQTVTVHFDVIDTGIGLTSEAAAFIFQPFFQADGSAKRRYGGTGLGLAISRRLVKLMGGEIGVKSQLDVGSTFWFEIPLTKQLLSVTNHASNTRLQEIKGQRALILDKNATNRSVLTYQLAGWEVAADEVENSDEVLSYLYRAFRYHPYGFAILDMGSGGLEVARQIRSDHFLLEVRIILLTVSSHRSYRQAVEGLSDITFLSKPLIRSWQLIECLGAPKDLYSTCLKPKHISEQPAVQQWRILVAEDNIINQKVIVRQLEKLGYRVDVVANGVEVIEAIRRIPYSLILMDCQMPELDGFETTLAIRAQSGRINRIAIVAMTAHAMQGDRQKCLSAGMDDYLSKPVSQELLASTLKKWLPDDKAQQVIKSSDQI